MRRELLGVLWVAALGASACAAAPTASGAAAAPAMGSPGGIQTGPNMSYDPLIISTLLQLLQVNDSTSPSNSDFSNTSLKDIIPLGTPSGYHLRNRYIHLGVPLADALDVADDPRLRDQLLELARWERNPQIRAVGLISLARRKEPEGRQYFHEALLNPKVEVRFAALEALGVWGRPESAEEYQYALRTDLSPVVQIYAAQALARLGDASGMDLLRRLLDSSDWVARAMSAMYLGDLGTADDYDRVLDRMVKDQSSNDFVTAECAIAALKLFPKKQAEEIARLPPPSTTAPSRPVPGAAGFAGEFELDPLVVTAPRLKIPATLSIDGRVNTILLQLLQNKVQERLTDDQLNDAGYVNLEALSSPVGFLLQVRYTELGFLLTEGLAGTADLIVRNQIINIANTGTNPQTRAAAMMALAFSKDPADRGVFQSALLDRDITVRFGAVEALQIWGFKDALSDIGNVARGDFSYPLQVYAAQMLAAAGDPGGRDVLIRKFEDSDWMVRAMAIRYLGLYGVADDYDRLLLDMRQEQNLFVQAEMCGALLRLNKLRHTDAH